MSCFSKIIKTLSLFAILSVLLLSPGYAAMLDYCINPPFVVSGVNPNLLIMFDNSASMFDLQYIDQGSATRTPYYCYDMTYNFGLKYAGYFQDWYHYYAYDFANDYFYEVAALPSGATCDKFIPGTLCVNGANLDNDSIPKTVTGFVAEGNYLNWISASKFDIQKKILTGGKYVEKACSGGTVPLHKTISCKDDADCNEYSGTCVDVENGLIGESRGCVGRKFIKEPIVEQTYTEGGTNTDLGITFGVRGPNHPYSEYLLSPGGQTYMNIYYGSYEQDLCNVAVQNIVDEEDKQTILDSIELCLNFTKGDFCSLNQLVSCKDDTDCDGTADDGVCTPGVPDGVCQLNNDGVCSITTFGVCTPDNGVCRKVKPRICVGGGKDGASCNNDTDCQYSDCTIGDIDKICSVNADCNLETCSNPGNTFGNACVVNAECNNGACTAPLVNVGNACAVSSDCNSATGACSAPPLNVGKPCAANTECNTGYAGICQQPVTQQIKSTFAQSMLSCYKYWDGTDVGSNEIEMVTNPSGCNQIYREYTICNGGDRDGKICSAIAPCTGGGICQNGPTAIRPGSAALLCSASYAGYCAGTSDDWATTDWFQREFPSPNECILQKFREYCTGAQVPPVTDPTDDPVSQGDYDNLPAIIADMGLESQLGDPIEMLRVKLQSAAAPSGLFQEFESLIRFGAMNFNDFGSAYESTSGFVPGEKRCTTVETTCITDEDCPGAGETCELADNYDGAKILESTPGSREGYIQGKCSVTQTDTCTKDQHCPADEKCIFSVGTHDSGLVKAVDDLFGSSWTPFAEGFFNAIGYFAQREDIRINANDFTIFNNNLANPRDPVAYLCQKNNILLITDGMSTTDITDFAAYRNTITNDAYNDPNDTLINTASLACPKYAGSKNLDDLAWLAKHKSIYNFDEVALPSAKNVNSKTINTIVVFSGEACDDPTNPDCADECNPQELLMETAENGCGSRVPDEGCYFEGRDPVALSSALRAAFTSVLKRASSGTAASVLASGEGSGANLIQALFYPERIISGKPIQWTGSLQNYWYFIDPFFGLSSIREDSNSPAELNLKDDYIVRFQFPHTVDDENTIANLFEDSDGDGDVDVNMGFKYLDDYLNAPDNRIKYLWEAGKKLFERPTIGGQRTIYTTIDSGDRVLFNTPLADGSSLITLLQAPNKGYAERIVSYVRGTDYNTKFCSLTVTTACNLNTDCPAGESCIRFRDRTVTIDGVTNTWKLGDIVTSTPKIASWFPLNTYHKTYADSSYGPIGDDPNLTEPVNNNYFLTRPGYKNRGMVFVGANDGMLHAFKLGTVNLYEEKYKKASLTGTDLGKEQWAFIPKHVLPYLKYLADPNYCHVYFVDAVPHLFDVSIGGNNPSGIINADSWRTILIGGTRLGGGCKNPTDSDSNGVADQCTIDLNGDGLVNNEDCELTPAAGIGYSSYFALDITNTLADPTQPPEVLWEFSDEDIARIDAAELTTGGLGHATSGPAIIRIGDKGKNGRWFVVLGSGPTGPIDTASNQFLGRSDQEMKLFVIELKDKAGLSRRVEANEIWFLDTLINYGFSGSLVGSPIDLDQNKLGTIGNYSDDALYVGYTQAEGDPDTSKWTKGGVLRLTTHENPSPLAWELTRVIENIGPVTSTVAKLQNYTIGKEALWLFFGSGRFFYKKGMEVDDADSQRTIYGIQDPCFDKSSQKIDLGACTPFNGDAAMEDVTFTSAGVTSDSDGWKILLDKCTASDGVTITPDCNDANAVYKTERLTTDPLSTGIGAVFFTTVKPTLDPCAYGGITHLWAVQYSTGGALKKGVLRGKALIQVSTGSIIEKDLATAFTQKKDFGAVPDETVDYRRTEGDPGMAAEDKPQISVPPKPLKRMLHMMER